MKKLWMIAAVVCGGMFSGCSADATASHETIAQQGAKLIEQVVPMLDGIKDDATVKALVDKVRPIASKLTDLDGAKKLLGEPTAEVRAKVGEILKGPLAKLNGAVSGLALKPEQLAAVRAAIEPLLGLGK